MAELTLFEQIGGYDTLKKVHKIFYDKAYADLWMKPFFEGISQEVIENQQTDFMAQAMGGPAKYCGKFPIPAHKHMNISEELFDYRHQMLETSLIEAGVSESLRMKWLKIDGAFRTGIIKKSLADCEKRFATDTILDFPKPMGIKSAA